MLKWRTDGHPVITIKPSYFDRLQWRLRNRLPMWVVYTPTTRQYPGLWVARMHVSLPDTKPTRFVISHDTLEELRSILPKGLVCIGRMANDTPEIVEVWM